jgi:diacylglycerol kinase (ATP)
VNQPCKLLSNKFTQQTSELDAMTRPHLHLIVNPCAGHQKARTHASDIESRLTGLGLEVTVAHSKERGDISALAQHAADAGIRHIAVAGGDGSVCEAVNGLMRSPAETALGILPVGTGNDFVKTAGLARNWQDACQDIALACKSDQALSRVDAGICNGHYFMNCLGIGLDARIAMEANRLKHFGGRTVYLLALVKTLWKGIPRPRAIIESGGLKLDQEISLITVCNGQVVGSLFRMAPNARIDDGLLDVVIARGVGRFEALGLAHKVIKGTHESLPQVRTLQARQITVHLDEPTPIEADGELIAENAMALDIKLIPAALTLLSVARLPETTADT